MSLRVLIADPSEMTRSSYAEYLTQHGLEVATAGNGLDCLEKIRRFAPDVLVLEPAIPWGGGDGVLALMHEESDMTTVRVMILTEGCDAGVLYNIGPFSVADFRRKPLSASRLLDLVVNLAKFRAEEQVAEKAHPVRH